MYVYLYVVIDLGWFFCFLKVWSIEMKTQIENHLETHRQLVRTIFLQPSWYNVCYAVNAWNTKAILRPQAKFLINQRDLQVSASCIDSIEEEFILIANDSMLKDHRLGFQRTWTWCIGKRSEVQTKLSLSTRSTFQIRKRQLINLSKMRHPPFSWKHLW